MKRINARPIGMTAAGAAGVVVLTLLAHYVQVGRTAARLLTRASAAERSGQSAAVLDLLTKYLALRPDDREVKVRHALLLDQTAATPAMRARALSALTIAVRGLPGRTDVRRRLAEALTDQGRYKDARTHLRVLVTATPDDAALAELMGRCEEAVGDADAAARWYDLALKHDPRRRLAALGLASLSRGPLHDPERGDRAVDALVEADAQAFDVWLARARYRRAHQLAGADDDLERARKLAPDDPGVLLETACAARARGDEPTARAVLDAAAARHPGDPQFVQERAELELKAQRPEEAIAILRRGLLVAPGATGLRWSLANLAAARGDVPELARQLNRLRAEPAGYPPATLDYLSAWLETLRSRWAEAARILERISPGLVAWPEIHARAEELLARCYGQLGDVGRQADANRRALTLDPRRGGARLDLAAQLSSQGRVDEADRLLRDPAFVPPAAMPIGLARLSVGLALSRGDRDGARDAARHYADDHQNDADARLWLGDVLASTGHLEEAETEFRRAAALDPSRPSAWVALVRLLVRADRTQEAAAVVTAAERALPETGGARARALGPCYDALGRIEPAREQFRIALVMQADAPEVRRDYAQFVTAHGPPEEVAPALRVVLSHAEHSSADAAWARRTLAVWLAGTGDPAKVREALALLDETHTDAPDDRRARARVLAVLGPAQRREALALLENLAASATPTADDRTALGVLYESLGDWPRARSEIATVAGSEALDNAARARLAEILLRHGEPRLASPLVARLARDEPTASRSSVLRARLLHAQGDTPAAIALLTDRTRSRPTELPAAAALLDSLGATEAAESLYRAAVARRDRPTTALALAVFLAKHGRTAEAWRLCDQSWDANRPADAARAVAAVFNVAPPGVGSTPVLDRLDTAAIAANAAVPVLTSLASIRELQGRFDDAEALYRRALRRDGGDPVALNNLAVLLALRGGDPREAVDLADRALARAGEMAELLDTRGLVRIAAGDAAGAIADLNSVVASSPSAPAYFHLAQAYLLAHARDLAAAALRQAVALGLVDRALHPLERVAYRQVVADLGH